MRLVPLPESKLESMRPICDRVKTEYGFGDRFSTEQTMTVLSLGYENKSLSIYVDDVDKINHCVILTHTLSMVCVGITTYVMFLYSTPENRGEASVVEAMRQIIEGYARVNGSSRISGSAWTLNSHKGMDALWKKWGFEKQETVYCKYL